MQISLMLRNRRNLTSNLRSHTEETFITLEQSFQSDNGLKRVQKGSIIK